MQEASVLKPYALSLLLLPSADKLFSCQWTILHSLTRKILVSACQNRKKNSQCWQENYLSGNEIWNFFRKILIFRYHWQVKYLSAIERSNHLLPIFFDFDKCFSCQCMNFLYFLISLTRIFLVSKPFYIHWQEKFLSVHAKFTVDKSFTCQAMKFETFSGKSLFFNITYLYIYIYTAGPWEL